MDTFWKSKKCGFFWPKTKQMRLRNYHTQMFTATRSFGIITSFPSLRFPNFFLLGKSAPVIGFCPLTSHMHLFSLQTGPAANGRGPHENAASHLPEGWVCEGRAATSGGLLQARPEKWFSLGLIKDDLMSIWLHLSLCWAAIVSTKHDKA